MTRRRYPITHYALCCGLGRTTESAIAQLRAGQRGLREVPFEIPFEAITGTLPGELPELPDPLRGQDSRSARLGALAYQQIADPVAEAIAEHGADRVALILGTSTGGIDRTEGYHFRWFGSGAPEEPPPAGDYNYFDQHCFHAFADTVAAISGIRGPRWVVSTACSSSAKVFSSARRVLDLGLADAVLLGGVDGLCNTTVRGFNSLGVMANEPCRPFGANRPGMNVGEGAAFLLMKREGKGRAYLRGVGETSDAYHMSSPEPEGKGALAAMQQALGQAGLNPEAVGYINAHGTGTPYNDAAESKAVHALFGAKIPVVSTKAYTGHTLGACGAIEAIFSIVALEQGWVPAAVGSHPVDPDIEIRVPEAVEEHDLRYVISNAFAFGGNNCSLLLERGEA